jgi:hypothetical protein
MPKIKYKVKSKKGEKLHVTAVEMLPSGKPDMRNVWVIRQVDDHIYRVVNATDRSSVDVTT